MTDSMIIERAIQKIAAYFHMDWRMESASFEVAVGRLRRGVTDLRPVVVGLRALSQLDETTIDHRLSEWGGTVDDDMGASAMDFVARIIAGIDANG